MQYLGYPLCCTAARLGSTYLQYTQCGDRIAFRRAWGVRE